MGCPYSVVTTPPCAVAPPLLCWLNRGPMPRLLSTPALSLIRRVAQLEPVREPRRRRCGRTGRGRIDRREGSWPPGNDRLARGRRGDRARRGQRAQRIVHLIEQRALRRHVLQVPLQVRVDLVERVR